MRKDLQTFMFITFMSKEDMQKGKKVLQFLWNNNIQPMSGGESSMFDKLDSFQENEEPFCLVIANETDGHDFDSDKPCFISYCSPGYVDECFDGNRDLIDADDYTCSQFMEKFMISKTEQLVDNALEKITT